MKNILSFAISFGLLTNLAHAEILNVEVPAGYKVVELSTEFKHSGCGSTTSFLDVLYSEDLDRFITGWSTGIKHDNDVVVFPVNSTPTPGYTCQAIVSSITKAKFTVYGPKSITVEVPDAVGVDGWKSIISDVKQKN